MISKLIGFYLLVDGIGSWLIYRKQKLLITKRRIFSLIPFVKVSRLKGVRIRTVKQSSFEHLFRFIRAGVGLGLLLAPLPF